MEILLQKQPSLTEIVRTLQCLLNLFQQEHFSTNSHPPHLTAASDSTPNQLSTTTTLGVQIHLNSMFVDLPRTQLHFNYNNVTINLAFDKQLCKPLRLRTTFKCIACEVYVLRGCLLQDRGPKVHTGNNSWLGRSDAGREEEVEKRNRKKG